MKNKIAIASAFVAASSLATAEIVINEFLSFEGFIDMSYVHSDQENGGSKESTNSFDVDQAEISWLFDFDPVTAQIDVTMDGGDGTYDSDLEQAFVTYHFDNGGAITAGRYASMLGFEAFEPTGLYQYSTAYLTPFLGELSFLPGYQQGVKYTYETDTTFFGIALVDSAFGRGRAQLGGDSSASYGVEAAASLDAGNGVTLFLGGAYEDGEDGDNDTYVINGYVTFEVDQWIFAAEYNFGNSESGQFALGGGDVDANSALIMANFAYSDQASVTGRISWFDIDNNAGTEADGFKYTLAHNYAFTDNLLLVTEASYVDGEMFGSDYEELFGALELLFTF